MKMCPACEGVLCGLCGECHDLDNRSPYRREHVCPKNHYMHHGDLCVTWSTAYQFLKDAGKQIEWKRKVIWAPNEHAQHLLYSAPGSPIVICFNESGWKLPPYADGHPGYASCAAAQCNVLPVWRSYSNVPGYLVNALRREHLPSHVSTGTYISRQTGPYLISFTNTL